MSKVESATGILMEPIRQAASILEHAVGTTIDRAEGELGTPVEVVEFLEVVEATLAYHRRSFILARSEPAHDERQSTTVGADRSRCHEGIGVKGVAEVRDDGANMSLHEQLLGCGAQLRALALLYGVLQRIARAEGFVEVAHRAELHRRDLADLEEEIERSRTTTTHLTGVINARNVIDYPPR